MASQALSSPERTMLNFTYKKSHSLSYIEKLAIENRSPTKKGYSLFHSSNPKLKSKARDATFIKASLAPGLMKLPDQPILSSTPIVGFHHHYQQYGTVAQTNPSSNLSPRTRLREQAMVG